MLKKLIYMSEIHVNKSIHYLLTINRRESLGIKRVKSSNTFFDYLQTSDDVYENTEDFNPKKKRKVLIVFDDMIGDKKLSPFVNKVFLTGRKLNISLVYISESYFKVL